MPFDIGSIRLAEAAITKVISDLTAGNQDTTNPVLAKSIRAGALALSHLAVLEQTLCTIHQSEG